ncbi:MAG TPA: hypothetical protein DCL44_08095 [Elusimicrobia bacterium]|nr:hypothetical protein [Elusimicrobiota bacterium]
MFNPLKTEDYSALKIFFTGHRYPLCEYSLASIIVWNRCLYEVSWKIEGDTLLVAETDLEPPAARRLLMPLPCPCREISPLELSEIARRNRHARYYYVPESYIEPHRAELGTLFNITEQAGYMDYIYDLRDMAGLAGHKYSKKRNLIAQFNKQSAEERGVKVEPMTQKNSGLCLDLLNRWAADPETGKHLDMLNCERKAIINSLNRFEQLEMEGVLVFIGGEISGFAFGSRLSGDTFVLNFEKALDNVKGLYQFLDNELAKHLPAQYAFINKESDLEKPGLAKAKESYYPCRKVKSYTLTLK